MSSTNEACWRLIAEFDRVLGSPYPTELKTLHGIVCLQITQTDVDRCLRHRACQIDGLAACVLEGLRYWPYVLDIISRLALVPAFRDSLLRIEPLLLRSLIVRGLESPDQHSACTTAAVSMLATPLPKDCSVPAEAQTLLLGLVDTAASEPSNAHVKPVYRILSGSSTALVGLLSNETLRRLESQLDGILRSSYGRSSHDADHQLLTLHCLAVMQCLVSAVDGNDSMSNDLHSASDLRRSVAIGSEPWEPSHMRKFFSHGTKATKTVQLLVLQVIWACQSHAERDEARLEALRLANKVIGAVSPDIRSAWCSISSSIIQKLQQKVLACGEKLELQLEAAGFVFQLGGKDYVSETFMQTIRRTISQKEFASTTACVSCSTFKACIDGCANSETARTNLTNLMSALQSAGASQLVEAAPSLETFLDWLDSRLNGDPEVLAAVISCCNAQDADGITTAITNDSLSATDSITKRPCRTMCLHKKSRLAHHLSKIYLRALLLVSKEELPFAHTNFDSWLQLHAVTASDRLPPCPLVEFPRKRLITIVGVDGVEPQAPLDWRQALQLHLTEEAEMSHHKISSIFARACHDLQARCESVEQPLYEERAARKQLQNRLDELQAVYNELESRELDLKLKCEALLSEQANCARDTDESLREIERLLKRASDLETHLGATLDTVKAEQAAAKSAMEAKELEHATAIARAEENLDDLREVVADKDVELHKHAKIIEDLQAEVSRISAEQDVKETEAKHLRQELDSETAKRKRWSEKSEEAEAQQILLEADLTSLNAELQRMKADHEENSNQIKEKMRQTTEALDIFHRETVDRIVREHEAEIAGVESRLADAQHEIQRLRQKCAQKDQMIVEADAMRTNLLAALSRPQAPSSLVHRPRHSKSTQLSQVHEDFAPPTLATGSVASDGRSSFGSNASTDQNRSGPTPKRLKPRKSFKVASPLKSRTSLPAKGTRLGAPNLIIGNRRPLVELETNRSPIRAAAKRLCNVKSMPDEDEFEDSTCDDIVNPGAGLGHTDFDAILDEENDVE